MATYRRSRSPNVNSSSSSTKTKRECRNSTPPTVDLITFRLEKEMVYVSPTKSFEDLLDTAQQQFPSSLMHLPRDRIAFSIGSRVGKDHHSVRISAQAWPRLLDTLARFEIVDIRILPFAPRAAKSDTDVCSLPVPSSDDVPPQYSVSMEDCKRPPSNDSNNFLTVPNPPQLSRRCSSAIGWIGDKLQMR